MITYCSHCKINWAALWVCSDDEHSTEFCPECKTDMFLEDGNDIVSYVKSPYDGIIRETGTMKELDRNPKPKIRVKLEEVKVWDESWEEYRDRIEQAEEKAIDLYMDGKANMIKAEPVERKFHIEKQYKPTLNNATR